jgi:transposase
MPFNAFAKILSRVKIEIVKRSDQAKGFVTLPKRWIVERTIAWLNRCRRPAKDCRVRGRRLGCIGHPKVRIHTTGGIVGGIAVRLARG